MRIIVYSKDECDFCDKARDLLKQEGMHFIEYKLGRDFSREVIKEVYPLAKSFPVIIFNRSYIGGYEELHSYIMNRKRKDTS